MSITPLYEPYPGEAPDSHGAACCVMELIGEAILSLSIQGWDAQSDDDLIPWEGLALNDNERPFAWRDRRPQF